MSKNLYVGNLSYSVRDDELRELFSQFGKVDSARVITDHDTGRSKGFGFVEMPEDAEAQAAIDTVNEAKPREPRGPRPHGGMGGYGRR